LNKYLVQELKGLGLWTEEIRNKIKLSEGSIQDIEEFSPELKERYRTAWRSDALPHRHDGRPRRLHRPIGVAQTCSWKAPISWKLSSMYMYAWQKGLKTTYYHPLTPGDAHRAGDSGLSSGGHRFPKNLM
jgi:ribonucleoside-diphosphate reductase alpha chain